MLQRDYSNEELKAALMASDDKQNEALGWIYKQEKWRKSVFKFVFDRGGDENLATEIFQEGIVIFARKVMQNDFKGDSTLFTYFIGICKKCYLRKVQKKNIVQEQPDQVEDEGTDGAEGKIIEQERTKEQKNLMRHLMSQLKEKCQSILKMYSLGYSMEEIAEEMGYGKAQAAKNAAYKCRKRLREFIISDPSIYQKVQQMI